MGVIADTGCLLCFISTKHLPNGWYETPCIIFFKIIPVIWAFFTKILLGTEKCALTTNKPATSACSQR